MTEEAIKFVEKSVFLVDDDEDDQFLLQRLLAEHYPDYRLKPLGNGLELLQALKAGSTLPTLVLLDLNMPGMGGFEALEQVRADAAFQTVPIVILTTSNERVDQQKAVQLGANAFITKPINLPDFKEIIQRLGKDWL